MSALREISARFGIEFDASKLEAGNKKIDSAIDLLRTLGTVIAGAEIVHGLHEFLESFVSTGAAVQQSADMLGIGTQELQALQYAAGQAGIGAERFNGALTRLNVGIDNARAGTGPAAQAFRRLGVSVVDAHGVAKPMGEVLDGLAAGFSRITDPSRRTGIAVDLFGRAGARMVNVLHDGEGGLADMRAQFEALGGGMTEDAVHAAEDYERATRRQDVSWMAMKSTIANILLPALTSITDWVTHAIASITALTRNSSIFQAALVALGVVAAIQLLPIIIRVAEAFTEMKWAEVGAFAYIAIAVLILDDLITLFRGGHSVIGHFIDRIFGVGASVRFVHLMREAWQDLKDVLSLAWDTVKGIVQDVGGGMVDAAHMVERAFTSAWNAIDNVFGGALTRMRAAFDLWFAPIKAMLIAAGILQPDTVVGNERIRPGASATTDHRDDARTRGNPALQHMMEVMHHFQRTGDTGVGQFLTMPARGGTAPAIHQTTQHNTVHIHGGDTEHVRRVVTEVIDGHARRQADDAHPLPQRE